MRILMLGIVMILLVSGAYALNECQRRMEPGEIPCNIISSWDPGTCGDYSLTVYNSSGTIVQTLTWGDYTPTCNTTFNITALGTYYYNSSVENGIIIVEGSKMWIMAILLLPLGLCFLFLYLANSLEDVHNPLRWFFRLISLIMVFVVYQGAYTITQLNPGYEGLADMFSITVYGWIFWTIMAYLLIYIIYHIFMSFKHNKEWDFSEDWLK